MNAKKNSFLQFAKVNIRERKFETKS